MYKLLKKVPPDLANVLSQISRWDAGFHLILINTNPVIKNTNNARVIIKPIFKTVGRNT